MKVFFASFTSPEIEVDAHVPTAEQGEMILRGLTAIYPDHAVIMRARVKRHQDLEERFLGAASDAAEFFARVLDMDARVKA